MANKREDFLTAKNAKDAKSLKYSSFETKTYVQYFLVFTSLR